MFRVRSEALQFPCKEKLPSGQTFIVDLAKPEDIDYFYRIYQDYADDGMGFSKTEYPTNADFAALFHREDTCWMTITDEETNELGGLSIVMASPLCRSTRPIISGGFIMILPGKKGTGTIAARLIIKIGTKLGYYAGMARISVSNLPNLILFRRKILSTSLGLIPNGVYIAGTGWVDDVVTFDLYNPDENIRHSGKAVDPGMFKAPTLEVIQPDTWQFPFENYMWSSPDGEQVCICSASLVQKLAVEGILQAQARNGSHIGMDEFTDTGLFNRKFFKKSMTLVAVSPKGDIYGAVIIGPTKFSREQNPRTLHVYALAPQYEQLEEELYKCAYNIALKADMLGLITDAFANDVDHLKLLMRLSFYVTASLPCCAFLQNKGYSDSLVMYAPTYPKYRSLMTSNL